MIEKINTLRKGESVDISGISNTSGCGRHEYCGCALEKDVVVRFVVRMVPTGEIRTLEETLAADNINDRKEENSLGKCQDD